MLLLEDWSCGGNHWSCVGLSLNWDNVVSLLLDNLNWWLLEDLNWLCWLDDWDWVWSGIVSIERIVGWGGWGSANEEAGQEEGKDHTGSNEPGPKSSHVIVVVDADKVSIGSVSDSSESVGADVAGQ